MKIVVKNADIYINGSFKKSDLLVNDGVVEKVAENISFDGDAKVITGNKRCVVPGLFDVHLHLREPGFE